MDDTLETQISALASQRRVEMLKASSVDDALSSALKEALSGSDPASVTHLSQITGLSRTYVRKLAARELVVPVNDRLSTVRYSTIPGMLADSGEKPVRIISAFEESDVWQASGLSPFLFEEAGQLHVPNMLLQLDSGGWLGVGTVQVGYGGTGPSNALRLLKAFVDDETAERAADSRFSDINLLDPEQSVFQGRWPAFNLDLPTYQDGRLIVEFSEAHIAEDPAVPSNNHSNFFPSPRPVTHLQAWLDLLDSDNPPDWASGPRRARAFLSRPAAAQQGFVFDRYPSPSGPGVATVIVEQGYLQLWFAISSPLQGAMLAEEAYEVLARANVYPEDFAAADERAQAPFRRFLRAMNLTPAPRLNYIDISPDGEGTLAYIPAATASDEGD